MGRTTARTAARQLKKMRDKVRHKRQLLHMSLTDLSAKRSVRRTCLPPNQTLAERARQMFGVVHAIIMGLIEECSSKSMFIVEDIQRMTVLPLPDVEFAIRDLLRGGLIVCTPVPQLYCVTAGVDFSAE
jgi:hypothetical protein